MPRTKRKVKRAKKKSNSDDTVDSHEEGAISTGECEVQGIEEDDLGACGGLAAGTKIKSIKRPKRCMDEDGFFFDLSANMSDMDTADPDNSESDDCHGPVSIYVNENVCQGRYTVDKKEVIVRLGLFRREMFLCCAPSVRLASVEGGRTSVTYREIHRQFGKWRKWLRMRLRSWRKRWMWGGKAGWI